MAEVKYQGPVTIHKMIDPVRAVLRRSSQCHAQKRQAHPDMPVRRDVHLDACPIATILVINEKAVLGGLKVSRVLGLGALLSGDLLQALL